MRFRDMSLGSRKKLFYKHVRYYFFDVFKLYDYELYFEVISNKDVRARMLQHEYKCGSCMVTISVSKQWLKECESHNELKKVAFHEVFETMLGELGNMVMHYSGHTRDEPTPNLNAATHRVIRRMENIVFPLIGEMK